MSIQIKIVQSTKNIVKNLLFHSGYYKHKTSAATREHKRLLVLMYHDLIEDSSNSSHESMLQEKLTRSQFESHMSVISKQYRVLTVAQAIEELKTHGDFKENTVAITFDDGFASVDSIAAPILRKYNIPATVFLATDFTNGKLSFWWENFASVLEQSDFEQTDRGEIERILRQIPDSAQQRRDEDPRTKRGFFISTSYVLMQLEDSLRNDIVEQLSQVFISKGSITPPAVASLTWEEIKALADSGVEFSAHTCSHLNMSHCSLEQGEDEIRRSKEEIEGRLGLNVKGFAYPYGYDYKGYVRYGPVLQKLGLDYACASWWGNNDRDANRYVLLRNVLPDNISSTMVGRELHMAMAE